MGRLSQPRIQAREFRENPFAKVPVLKQKDLEIGMFEVINQHLIPRNTDIMPAFNANGKPVFKTEAKK